MNRLWGREESTYLIFNGIQRPSGGRPATHSDPISPALLISHSDSLGRRTMMSTMLSQMLYGTRACLRDIRDYEMDKAVALSLSVTFTAKRTSCDSIIIPSQHTKTHNSLPDTKAICDEAATTCSPPFTETHGAHVEQARLLHTYATGSGTRRGASTQGFIKLACELSCDAATCAI